jgi:hypothetical protein
LNALDLINKLWDPESRQFCEVSSLASCCMTWAFTVNFTARTVGGSISLEGRTYSLQNVVFTADSTGFSGRLTTADPNLDGSIEGRFTGALASEMMGRLQVPPTQGQSMFLFTGSRS